MESKLRTVACWLTVLASIWTMSYYFAYGTKEGSAFIIEDLTVPLISEYDISWENGARLVMLIAPVLLVTALCNLIVTNAHFHSHLQIWTNHLLGRFRGFSGVAGDGLDKKNQYGLGDFNFDVMSFFLVSLPCITFFFCTLNKVLSGPELEREQKLKVIGNALGMAGTLALSFFLIPVTRHSVLLVAMGWSPLQALRIHIWAGYTSFVSIALHGLIHFIVWLRRDDVSLWDQVMPDTICWEWDPSETPPRECRVQWYNFAGVVSFLCFAILIVTSLNWFRRRYYRLFYIFHMVFGIGMLAGAAMHWRPVITFLAPSILYYLASTMPALVQALASRVRGGVKIVQVVHLADAGGCKEIHIATSRSANTALDTVPSMYVKMCVPSISMVWHPFTVFKHPKDPSTVRILFRPVGPFTKALATRWEEEKHTPTIIDGFYHAGNRSLECLHHDHVVLYCGGVAITPFLSLIPDLLSEIARQKELGIHVAIKKLVFIWACREEGLASYITENYLKSMKTAADSMGFDFDVIVFHTQRKGKAGPLDPKKDSHQEEDETSNPLDTTFMSELTLDDMRAGIRRQSSRSSTPTKGTEDQELPSTQPLLENDDIPTYSYPESDAHDMELHRFMPAQHARVWHNIPAFLALGTSLWLLFYIIFYNYHGYDIHVHEFYDRLWPLIVCLLSSAGLALAFEGIAFLVTAVQGKGDDKEERPSNTPYLPAVDEETLQNAAVEHRCGRPGVADIFRGARTAECPGIFMCGPPAMTEKVRQEANKENSALGLTRYALYEDPFEM